MRAAVLTDIRTIQVQEVPTPKPKPDEVLIRVRFAGVCGSEVHIFIGTHPSRKPPAILGHEMVGEIVEVGSQVSHFRPDDRVTIEAFTSCGSCRYCRMGSYYLCSNKVLIGTPGWTGCFGEYIVAPERALVKLPEDLSYEEGVILEPMAVAVHAIKRARLQEGDSVLVLGAGAIGLCCIAAAKATAGTTVIATDTIDFNLKLARNMGAAAAVNVRKENSLSAVVAQYAGSDGVDVGFVTAGFSSVVNQALASVRKQGRVGLVAQFDDPLTIPAPHMIVSKELELLGILQYTKEDFHVAAELITRGLVDARSLITHVLPIEEAQRAMEIVADKTEDCAKVILAL